MFWKRSLRYAERLIQGWSEAGRQKEAAPFPKVPGLPDMIAFKVLELNIFIYVLTDSEINLHREGGEKSLKGTTYRTYFPENKT